MRAGIGVVQLLSLGAGRREESKPCGSLLPLAYKEQAHFPLARSQMHWQACPLFPAPVPLLPEPHSGAITLGGTVGSPSVPGLLHFIIQAQFDL